MSELESRPYGPEISETERQALRDQVTLLDNDIIFWREAPMPTTHQLDIYAGKLYELSAELDKYYLLVDLSRAARPTPEILEHVRNIMSKRDKLAHAAIFTEKNFMLNIAAKFLMARMGFTSYSIHTTRDEAFDAIQNARI